MNTITVRYFAVLAEKCGKREEQFQFEQEISCADLYAQIKETYQLSFDISRLRPAVNDEFSNWDRVLTNGDEMVIITPVAGG